MENAVAFYAMQLFTAVKYFMVQASKGIAVKPFSLFFFLFSVMIKLQAIASPFYVKGLQFLHLK